ncbi:hypothetical protein MMC11_003355, partial [Xylographa trunciseda]|nr:hypothetical protein [Xylographa trunciseda]
MSGSEESGSASGSASGPEGESGLARYYRINRRFFYGTIAENEDGDLIGNFGADVDEDRLARHIILNHSPNIVWWNDDPDTEEGGTIYVDGNHIITDELGEEIWDVHAYVTENHVINIVHEFYDRTGTPIWPVNEDWIPTRERRQDASLSVTSSEGHDRDEEEEEEH